MNKEHPIPRQEVLIRAAYASLVSAEEVHAEMSVPELEAALAQLYKVSAKVTFSIEVLSRELGTRQVPHTLPTEE